MNWICKAIAACLANKAHSFSSARLLGNKTFGACCSYKAVLQNHFASLQLAKSLTCQLANPLDCQPVNEPVH